MKSIFALVSAILLSTPVQAATLTFTQTATGSYENRFTRSRSETYDILDAIQSASLQMERFFFDNTAPGALFDSFNPTLGDLRRVEIKYERLGGLDDRILLRSSGCTTELFQSCTRLVSAQAQIDYGIITSASTRDAASRSFVSTPNLTSFVSFPEPRDAILTFSDSRELGAFLRPAPISVTPFFDLELRTETNCSKTSFFVDLTACSSEVRLQYSADWRITLDYFYDDGVTPPVSEVPLPAGAPLLLAGFGALALLRRRSAKREV